MVIGNYVIETQHKGKATLRSCVRTKKQANRVKRHMGASLQYYPNTKVVLYKKKCRIIEAI